METVILKNGAEEPKMLVMTIMVSLKSLWRDKPIAVYDLVELCKNPEYDIWETHMAALKDAGFIDGLGSIHSSVKNVVLSATVGEGMELVLGLPV